MSHNGTMQYVITSPLKQVRQMLPRQHMETSVNDEKTEAVTQIE